jgi:hypothetical protein
MNEQVRNYLLIGVAALTVINTIMIFTGGNDDRGRVIDTPATQTALVESTVDPNNPSSKPPLELNNTQPQPEQNRPMNPPTTIAFTEMEHDFGTIKQDSENKKVFKFTNTGDNPLIIQNARGSCGCTVPKYPKEPVAPGETGEIEVVYKPGKQKGNQSKTVTLQANTQPEQTVLKISAMVEEVAAAAN